MQNKTMNVYKIFCRNNFPWKDFIDTTNAFSTSPIEKIRCDFRGENYGSETKKKINNINFLDKSFFTQDLPLDSWKKVRKTWTKIFHQVSKWILPMLENIREVGKVFQQKVFSKNSSGDD